MLQFITSPCGKLPQARQAAMAVEGGCAWIELAPGEELEKTASELVELFKGEDIFLMVPDDVDLVDRLRVHGVVLSTADPKTVAETREKLGAHAVIGVRVASAAEAAAIRAVDIDYIIYGVPAGKDEALGAWSGFRSELDAAGVPFHAVASGSFDPETAAAL
ncbi:MAG: thiamine phosphate synthase, partial [[Clostridium] fimetarium]|nr:thiamine phosphate synthase [[Clostridium] fimetarium]